MDHGIGIPANKLGAVFETFTRIRNKNRIYEGTGLGLSIVYNIVKKHKGDISVKSEYGKGSNFTIEIPNSY